MSDHPDHPDSCPNCQALAERVAELERQLAERTESEPSGAPTLPFTLKALRIIEHGWGAGWTLRPSPPRRAWMDAKPHAYQCLPMVVANGWGWQVLCPTDVRVTWDGSPDRYGLLVEVDPQFAPAIKSQFGVGIVTFSPPGCSARPQGGTSTSRGRATAGSRTARRWKASSKRGGSTTRLP